MDCHLGHGEQTPGSFLEGTWRSRAGGQRFQGRDRRRNGCIYVSFLLDAEKHETYVLIFWLQTWTGSQTAGVEIPYPR